MPHASTETLRPLPDTIVGNLARFAGALWCIAVCLPGLVLCARRWAGALTAPLEGGQVVAVAIVAMLVAAVARCASGGGLRFAWLHHESAGAAWRRRAALVMPTVGLLLLGHGLTLPDVGAWPTTFVWTLLVAEEAASWWWLMHGITRRSRRPPSGPIAEPLPSPLVASLRPGEQLVQRQSRVRAADGGDVLRGSLRGDFAAGSRVGNLHVAFCPPFNTLPRFEFRQIAGPPARIKLGQLLPHGARLEIKLNDPAPAASTVWLEFEFWSAKA